MSCELDLIPPLHVLDDRLTRNLRERSLLQSLYRIALRAEKWKLDLPDPPKPCRDHEPAGVGR